jgi:hypothetical protein
MNAKPNASGLSASHRPSSRRSTRRSTIDDRRWTITAYLLLTLVLAPAAATAQGARIELDQLNRLAAKATETVDVTVDSEMLKKSAGFLAGKGADAAKLQEVIDGITGVYVKSFKFAGPDAYSESDVEVIRKQVAREGWSRIVGVKGKRDREVMEIYLRKEGGANGGLVVIAAQPNRWQRRSGIARCTGPDDSEAGDAIGIARRKAWSSFHGDLEYPRPQLSGHENSILLRIVGNPVEHRIEPHLGVRSAEQTLQVDPA